MDARIARRRIAVRRAAARRRRRATATVVAVLLLLGGGYLATNSPLFAVDDVRVTGARGERAAAVVEAAAIRPGDNILTLDTDAVRRRVQRLPWLGEVDVRRIPPTTIQIGVRVREPALVVQLARGAWVLDEDGVVLEGGIQEGLVLVEAPDATLPDVGQRTVDQAVRNALAVHRELPGPLRAAVLRYTAAPDELRLLVEAPGVTPEGVWVRFGRAERIEAKARVIGLVLEQARLATLEDRMQAIAELDVRAPDNPVIVPAAGAGDAQGGGPGGGPGDGQGDGVAGSAGRAGAHA